MAASASAPIAGTRGFGPVAQPNSSTQLQAQISQSRGPLLLKSCPVERDAFCRRRGIEPSRRRRGTSMAWLIHPGSLRARPHSESLTDSTWKSPSMGNKSDAHSLQTYSSVTLHTEMIRRVCERAVTDREFRCCAISNQCLAVSLDRDTAIESPIPDSRGLISRNDFAAP